MNQPLSYYWADDAADAFDEEWRRAIAKCSVPPILESYLPPPESADRVPCLTQLVAIDLERRWLQAMVPHSAEHQSYSNSQSLPNASATAHPLEHYLGRYPELRRAGAAIAELICAAYRVSRLCGQRPDVEEFAQRFADVADVPVAIESLHRTEREFLADSGMPGFLAAHERFEFPEFPGYAIVSLIAHGGRGVVYKAVQLRLRRMVALKTLDPARAATPKDIRRFDTEARAIAQLSHPNIVTVYEVGRSGRTPFIAMEYIAGTTLAAMNRDGAIAVRAAARYVAQAARALHYAHAKGVLHRDLKPSNILIDSNDQSRVTDFGLAKRLSTDSITTLDDYDLTGVHHLVGTPSFMAPEQLEPDKAQLGPRTDVYGLGATLYDLLSGRPPFRGESPLDTLELVRSEQPIPPRRLQPSVPIDLETICLKCLEKDPSRRYASAGELAHDLERFLAGDPVQARRAGLVRRARRWSRRHWRVALPSGTALALLALLLTFALWSGVRDRMLLDRERAARREAERNLYYSGIHQAEYQVRQNQIDQARRTLADIAPPAGSVDHRGWEWHFLRRLTSLSTHTLAAGTEPAEWVMSLVFSPDSRRLVTGSAVPEYLDRTKSEPGSLRIWSVDGAETLLDLGDQTLSVVSLAYSQDGQWIAAAEHDRYYRRGDQTEPPGRLTVWHAATGARKTLEDAAGSFHSVLFNATGKFLAAHSKEQLRVWDCESGRPIASLPDARIWEFDGDEPCLTVVHRDGERALVDLRSGVVLNRCPPVSALASERWVRSTDGRRIAALSGDGLSIGIWDTATAELVRAVPVDWPPPFALSPNGEHLALADSEFAVRLIHAATAQEVRKFRGHSARLCSVAFSPDGTRVASGDWSGTVHVWDLSPHFQESFVLGESSLDTPVEALAFAPDGSALRSLRPRKFQLSQWNLGSLEGLHVPLPIARYGRTPGRTAALSPDGRRAVGCSARDPKVLTIWDAETGANVAHLAGHEQQLVHVEFDQSGRRVVSAACNSRRAQHDPIRSEFRIWNAADGSAIWTHTESAKRVVRVAVSPDARLLAVCTRGSRLGLADQENSNSLEIWDTQAGSRVVRSMPLNSPVLGVCFHPDGDRIAIAEALTGRLKIVDVKTLQVRLEFPDIVERIEDLQFAPDGRRLAGLTRSHLVLWDSETGHQLLALRCRTSAMDYAFNPQLAFSPDGSRIAATQFDDTIVVWSAAGAPGTDPQDRQSLSSITR
jgi:WD40 repeat protein/predicted Ser/Thr protein kinase